MSKDSTTVNSPSIGWLGFLSVATFIVFLAMKLLGKIDWSWWWVTAPLWGYVVQDRLALRRRRKKWKGGK